MIFATAKALDCIYPAHSGAYARPRVDTTSAEGSQRCQRKWIYSVVTRIASGLPPSIAGLLAFTPRYGHLLGEHAFEYNPADKSRKHHTEGLLHLWYYFLEESVRKGSTAKADASKDMPAGYYTKVCRVY